MFRKIDTKTVCYIPLYSTVAPLDYADITYMFTHHELNKNFEGARAYKTKAEAEHSVFNEIKNLVDEGLAPELCNKIDDGALTKNNLHDDAYWIFILSGTPEEMNKLLALNSDSSEESDSWDLQQSEEFIDRILSFTNTRGMTTSVDEIFSRLFAIDC